MRAIKVEDEDMARLVREQDLEVIKPELGTRPRVYYRNLWRYSKCFIGGSVAEERQGIIECVEGASVQLVKDGASLAVTTTDNFGDFKFDRLDENSGSYSVQIFSGGRSKVLQVSLGTSVNLGEIRI
jgi:hypothetical protein